MAWLELARSGVYQICFRLGDKRFSRSLRTEDEKTAAAAKAILEESLSLVERGRLKIPQGADVAKFLLSNGEVTGPIKVNTVRLDGVRGWFLALASQASLDDHFRFLGRLGHDGGKCISNQRDWHVELPVVISVVELLVALIDNWHGARVGEAFFDRRHAERLINRVYFSVECW
jgi:hypothetical protein